MEQVDVTAAAAPTLTVTSALVCCSLERMTGGAEPRTAHPATMLHAQRVVSKYPPALARWRCMRCISVYCCTCRLVMQEAAALVLCLFAPERRPHMDVAGCAGRR